MLVSCGKLGDRGRDIAEHGSHSSVKLASSKLPNELSVNHILVRKMCWPAVENQFVWMGSIFGNQFTRMESVMERLGPRVSRPSLVRGDFAVFLKDSGFYIGPMKNALSENGVGLRACLQINLFSKCFSTVWPQKAVTPSIFLQIGGTWLLCTRGVLCVLLKGLCSSRGSPLPHHDSPSVIIHPTCSVCVVFTPIGFWTDEKPGTEVPVCMATGGRGTSRSYRLPWRGMEGGNYFLQPPAQHSASSHDRRWPGVWCVRISVPVPRWQR